MSVVQDIKAIIILIDNKLNINQMQLYVGMKIYNELPNNVKYLNPKNFVYSIKKWLWEFAICIYQNK